MKKLFLQMSLKKSNLCIFFIKSGKIYTWQNFFTQAPPVVPVTNMRYDLWVCKFEIWYQTPMLNIEAEIEKRVYKQPIEYISTR